MLLEATVLALFVRQFNYGKHPERSCEKHIIKQPNRSPLICILKRDQCVSLLVIDHRIGLSVEQADIEIARWRCNVLTGSLVRSSRKFQGKEREE